MEKGVKGLELKVVMEKAEGWRREEKEMSSERGSAGASGTREGHDARAVGCTLQLRRAQEPARPGRPPPHALRPA